MDEDKKRKGFAGLSSLTSKIEDHTSFESSKRQPNPDSSKESAQKKSEPSAPLGSTKTTSTQLKTPPPKKMLSGWKWLLGVITVVGIAAVYNSNQQSKPPSIPSTYTPPSSSYGTGTGTTGIKPEIVPKQKLKPVRPVLKLTFQKPPLGRDNVLSVEQIRWCQREDIRLSVQKGLIDNNAHVAQFNLSVNEYNQRCGNFRYRKGNLERARQEVEKLRAQIEKEARLQFQPAAPQIRKNVPTVQHPTLDTPQLSTEHVLSYETQVVEVQKILTNLGYDPGPIDGQFGKKTAKAIRQFQTQIGKEINGQISQGLLKSLRNSLISSTQGETAGTVSGAYFTLGSSQDDLARVQGTPDDMSENRSGGFETWTYGKSKVNISLDRRQVISWTNKENLKVKMTFGKSVTTDPYFTRGSHQDDVARVQGTPDKIFSWKGAAVETWSFGRSQVEISAKTRRVLKWTNTGNLKVKM